MNRLRNRVQAAIVMGSVVAIFRPDLSSVTSRPELPRGMSRLELSVELSRPELSVEWRLSPEPVLTIGEDGTPQVEFQRITGLTRTPSGDIVVANSGSNEIRIFNASGKFMKSYGRSGGGPGEFQSMRWIGKSADSLFVHDSQSMRLSTFTVNGGYLTARMIPSLLKDARIYPMARFNNGDLLVQPIRARSRSTPHSDGVFRDSIQVGVMSSTRPDSIAWIGTVPFMSWLSYNPIGMADGAAVDVYRFGPKTRWVVWGNLVWIGDEGSNELVLFDKTGRTVSRVQIPWPERPYDAVVFARAAKAALTGLSPAERTPFTEAEYSAKYLPRAEPSFKQFLVSSDGHLWIERFHFDLATGGECVVMTRAGTIVARLRIPGNFEPQEIGSDYVLGIQRNGDGVETVAMYRIWK